MLEGRFLNWSEEQWGKYDETHVKISLRLFDELATATELLARGSRPTKKGRSAWKRKRDICRAILETELDKIDGANHEQKDI